MIYMLKVSIYLFLCCTLYTIVACSPSFHQSSSTELCHDEERSALLHFKTSFTLDAELDECPDNKAKTLSSWISNRDCCKWEGVRCHPQTNDVIELDLSCAKLSGSIDSNSSLFLLTHLQSLNLASNDFKSSKISPKFGSLHLLEYLNLSDSNFAGGIPAQISQLTRLSSLDFTSNFLDLEPPIFKRIIDNLTELRELHLSNVNINSDLPESIANLSSLISLKLHETNLLGELPLRIFNLPHLKILDIGNNWPLQSSSSEVHNWSSPFEVIDLYEIPFKGKLPTSLKQSHHLRELSFSGCFFEGPIPDWVWNTRDKIDLSVNHFRGTLPSSVNTSKLSNLNFLSLEFNYLEGRIPSWLFTLPSLTIVSLVTNKFTGLPEKIDLYNNSESKLQELHLEGNNLQGSFPQWIPQLVNLNYFDISSNNLSGIVHLEMFTRLKKLSLLSLADNKLSVNTTITVTNGGPTTTWPNLTYLGLSSCNTGKVPIFLKYQSKLQSLLLSNNNIQGDLPQWLQNMTEISDLDLSNNSLYGGLEHLPWNNLQDIDLSFNKLKGAVPFTTVAPTISSFAASNNEFIGHIDKSICNLAYLNLLDISNNHLDGEIPECLGNLSNSLVVLNLGSNNFSGSLPTSWEGCDGEYNTLKYLDFSDNQLRGLLPRDLALCTSLEYLSFAKNRFNDTFPSWLEVLPQLQVLNLHSNSFHSQIKGSNKVAHPFPMVQIFDISDNKFSGNLPTMYIKNFNAMMSSSNQSDSLSYMGTIFYKYSIVLGFNGAETKYEKIITTMVDLDLSNNAFEGQIPYSVGQLVLIHGLNFSHNRLTGTIPPTFSNLKLLNSLDLSFNMLTGEIPQELASLTSLGVFEVSDNKLVGPIPRGNNFDTFSEESYSGNPGLCGFPLLECGENDRPNENTGASGTTNDDDYEDGGLLAEWKIVLIGYGCGTIVGMTWGCYMLSIGKLSWLIKLVNSWVGARLASNQR